MGAGMDDASAGLGVPEVDELHGRRRAGPELVGVGGGQIRERWSLEEHRGLLGIGILFSEKNRKTRKEFVLMHRSFN